jgi:hypothetical protein
MEQCHFRDFVRVSAIVPIVCVADEGWFLYIPGDGTSMNQRGRHDLRSRWSAPKKRARNRFV